MNQRMEVCTEHVAAALCHVVTHVVTKCNFLMLPMPPFFFLLNDAETWKGQSRCLVL